MKENEAPDLLGIQPFTEYMENQILHGFGNSHVGLNGAWGVGKTHFLKNLQFNFEKNAHIVIYIDAWKSDFASEPLVAIVSEISNHPAIAQNLQLDGLRKNIRSITNKIRLFGLNLVVSRLSHGNFNAEDVSSFFSTSNIFKDSLTTFENEKRLIAELQVFLASIVNQISLNNERKIIILIDELDRCNPVFAVQLLERIKHVLDVPDLKIIAAFDQTQLEATIKKYYGNDFDSQTYLEKFFPYIQKMPIPTRKKFIEVKLNENLFQNAILSAQSNVGLPDFANFADVFVEIADSTEMSLRKIQNILLRVGTAVDLDNPNRIDPIIALALVYLREADPFVYEQLAKGSNQFELILKHFEANQKLKKLSNINLFKYMEALMYYQEIQSDPSKNLNPGKIPFNGLNWQGLSKDTQEKLSRISAYQSLEQIADKFLTVQETIRRVELTQF